MSQVIEFKALEPAAMLIIARGIVALSPNYIGVDSVRKKQIADLQSLLARNSRLWDAASDGCIDGSAQRLYSCCLSAKMAVDDIAKATNPAPTR